MTSRRMQQVARVVLVAAMTTAAVSSADDTAPPAAGLVEGRITYRGKVPRHEVSDLTGKNSPLFVVHPESRGLRDAVVFLERRDEEDAKNKDGKAALQPAASERELPEVVIDQKDYVFVPHLVAVRVGQPVKFTSSDVANHNVRAISLEQKNQFNRFTGGGDSYTHRFTAERRNRPVRIGCDLHRWMGAWVFVFEHSRFAVTGEDGSYRVGDLPPGKYTLSFRQPDGGLRADRDIEIAAGKKTTVDFEFTEKDLRLE